MPPSWHPVPACAPRLCCRRANHRCSNDGAAAIPKFEPEIQNHCTMEGVSVENSAAIPKSGPEIKNRCTQEGINRQNLASIRKSGLEIKNRCTQEGVNRQILASIPKLGPEIKNHCTLEGVLQAGHSSLRQRKLESDAEIRCRKQPTPRPSPSTRSITRCRRVLPWMLHGASSTQVRQWRHKRVLMRPEAAFPYVSAAEGAQHPPKSRHAQRSQSPRNHTKPPETK